MERGIVLDESANRGGQHFAIMSPSLLARFVATQTPSAVDDCGHRHADALLCEAIPQGRVVVTGDRQSLILDHRFLLQECLFDFSLHRWSTAYLA